LKALLEHSQARERSVSELAALLQVVSGDEFHSTIVDDLGARVVIAEGVQRRRDSGIRRSPLALFDFSSGESNRLLDVLDEGLRVGRGSIRTRASGGTGAGITRLCCAGNTGGR
jgi:hypothetical protein